MSDDDAYLYEMGRFFRMSDRDLDRLLGGKAPEGDDELQALAALLREVMAAYLRAPAGSTATRQLGAILEAAQLLSEKGEPVARPASKATGPGRQASGLPTRRRMLVSQLFSTIWAKVAGASVAAAVISGALAIAGALPDSLQTAVANAADQVGVSLDNPADTDEPGDVDVADDDDANRTDDDADEPDSAKANARDDDADNGSDDDAAPAPKPAVNSVPSAPVAVDDDGEDGDDNASRVNARDDDNEADDQDEEADDRDEEADDENEEAEDREEADDQGAADEDHEGEGEADDD